MPKYRSDKSFLRGGSLASFVLFVGVGSTLCACSGGRIGIHHEREQTLDAARPFGNTADSSLPARRPDARNGNEPDALVVTDPSACGTCPAGQMCLGGRCQADPCVGQGPGCRAKCVRALPCGGVPCGAGESCVGDRCVVGCFPAPCDGLDCGSILGDLIRAGAADSRFNHNVGFCNGNYCDFSHRGCNADCGAGFLCAVETSGPSTCMHACEAGTVCVGGACVEADPCTDVVCGSGTICREGACVADSCAGVTCAGGSICAGGRCIDTCRCPDDGVARGSNWRCELGEWKCTPSCRAGDCGSSDGCGGACDGTCPAGQSCMRWAVGTGHVDDPYIWQCETPRQCEGKRCGDSDGAGGFCTGGCAAGSFCDGHECLGIPQCSGKACGAADGVGGRCQGTCPRGQYCDPTSYECQCVGTCEDVACGERGTSTCGTPCLGYECPNPGDLCVDGSCCRYSCPVDLACGSHQTNGCGGTCVGYACPGNQTCDPDGRCSTPACVPRCSSGMCGEPDGCGGTCPGSCAASEFCIRDAAGYACGRPGSACTATCGCGQRCVGGACTALCSAGQQLCGCSECCSAGSVCAGGRCVRGPE